MRQYVTEDEAKKKYCPTLVLAAMLPGQVAKHDWQCIATECMFWCWRDEYGAGMGAVASTTHGYCGATK